VLLASGLATRPKPIASSLAILFTPAGDVLSLRCVPMSVHGVAGERTLAQTANLDSHSAI